MSTQDHEPEADAEPSTEEDPEPEPDEDPDLETETEAETEPESEPEAEADADAGAATEAAPDGVNADDLDEGTVFEIIVEADPLETFVDQLMPLVDEAKIHVTGDGLKACAVDPANVGMVATDLAAEAFEHYALRAGGETIGVNLSRLADVLGFADAGDVVQMAFEERTQKLHIQVGTLDYTLAVIDPDSIREEPDIPDLDLPAEVDVEGRDLDRACTAADMVSDHVALGTDAEAEQFTIDAEGDTDDVHLELDGEDDCLDFDAGGADGTESLFSLDYLSDMVDPIGDDTAVSLLLGTEFPVKMRYKWGADREGETLYMLAPRIQSD